MKVKFISGNEITFDLEENTILEVKKKVADYKDSSPENVKLIYMGKVLNENDTFEMHKLTPDSVLTAVVKKTTTTTTHVPTPATALDPTPTGAPTGTVAPNIEHNNTTSDIPFNIFNNQNPGSNNFSMFNTMLENPEMRNSLINLSLQRMGLPNDHPFRSMLENNLNLLSQNPNMINQMMQGNNMDPNMINQMMQGNNMDPNMINQMMQGNNMDTNMINQMMQGNNMDPNMINQMMQGLNMINPMNSDNLQDLHMPSSQQDQNSTSGPPVTQTNNNTLEPEVNLEELRSKYMSELEEVKNMGFEDEELILKTLAQSHGSVVITINKLLS